MAVTLKSLLTVILTALLLWTAPAWAVIKYVDNTATGCSTPTATNYDPLTETCGSGTSTVYNTIETGGANVGASNTLLIRAGTYSGVGQINPTSGTVGAHTIIQNQPGETFTWTKTSGVTGALVYFTGDKTYIDVTCDVVSRCIFDGNNYSAGLASDSSDEIGVIIAFNASNITIRNLEIKNSRGNGIYSDANSHGWTIAGNLIHHTGDSNAVGHRGHSIYMEGDGHLGEYNTLHTAYGVGVHCYSGAPSTSCDSSTWRYNIIYNFGLSALSVLSGITVDGNSNLVYRNKLKCGPLGTTSDTNAFHRGIDRANTDGQADNNKIFHNSVTRCGSALTNTPFVNNTGNLWTNNLAYLNTNNAVITAGLGDVVTSTMTTNPSWTDANNANFTLLLGNAAIAAGTAITGFLCNGTCDAGAHETFGFSSATINENFMDVTAGMSLNTPLTASGITGFTVACSGLNCGTPIVSSAARLTGTDSKIRLNITGITTGVCAVGQTWTVTYNASTGNVTDFVGQPMTAFTTQAVTNACGAAPPTPPTGGLSLPQQHHHTTASGISIHCSFGSLTVSERVSPGRMGRSPESRQPVQDRFQIVPWPWNGPALYVTEHCTGK